MKNLMKLSLLVCFSTFLAVATASAQDNSRTGGNDTEEVKKKSCAKKCSKKKDKKACNSEKADANKKGVSAKEGHPVSNNPRATAAPAANQLAVPAKKQTKDAVK